MTTDEDHIFLKEWRVYAGLTQGELGQMMGITGTQISRVEAGKRDYDGRFLTKFKQAINTRIGLRASVRIEHKGYALLLDPNVMEEIRRLPRTPPPTPAQY